MDRIRFLKQTGQLILLILLLVVALLTGNKVVNGGDCNTCSGNGICSGKSDCGNY